MYWKRNLPKLQEKRKEKQVQNLQSVSNQEDIPLLLSTGQVALDYFISN